MSAPATGTWHEKPNDGRPGPAMLILIAVLVFGGLAGGIVWLRSGAPAR